MAWPFNHHLSWVATESVVYIAMSGVRGVAAAEAVRRDGPLNPFDTDIKAARQIQE